MSPDAKAGPCHSQEPAIWKGVAACVLLTLVLAFAMRLLEWPSWQNPEYRLGDQMLLATHDAYHWLAGAVGFGRAVDHPMSVMLRLVSDTLGLIPANVAFWFPAFFASLAAGMVCAWCALLENAQAGVAAGLIAGISPGFLGRTLLGYYDTDLVTLFFPLLIAIIPALWCRRFLPVGNIRLAYRMLCGRKKSIFPTPLPPGEKRRKEMQPGTGLFALPWILILALGGMLSWWAGQWHSVFPYLIRYNALLLTLLTLLLAPVGHRQEFLSATLCHSLPALGGPGGLLWPLLLAFWLLAGRPFFMTGSKMAWSILGFLAQSAAWLALLWLFVRGDILDTLAAQINAYLKPAGDLHASGDSSLLFPSVAQSIIEVQDLALPALFPYFHPWLEAALIGFTGFLLALFIRPLALFLLPLAALGLSSSLLGGRMVMFGAPIVALGLTIPAYWLIKKLVSGRIGAASCGVLCSLLLCGLLVAPFADMIPALSQGPVINRRHAAVLSQAATMTPQDAMLWLWWDWGYAAHYFARRATIADGAEHGGPSLYLPAAVFATDNPRFARQLIRYTSARGNIPGNFFKNMKPAEAQDLIKRLESDQQPLVRGKGRQFIIVSFEMLRLGFWISNYGNWNFLTGKGEGGAISILPQALAYNFETGEVRLEGRRSIIFPISISVFEETGLRIKNYVQEWFAQHPSASAARQKAFLESRRNINFLFNRVTDEKLAMDENIYRSMMARLLVCDPRDPAISPYFRLIYDNVFARIYEVLPASEESQ